MFSCMVLWLFLVFSGVFWHDFVVLIKFYIFVRKK